VKLGDGCATVTSCPAARSQVNSVAHARRAACAANFSASEKDEAGTMVQL